MECCSSLLLWAVGCAHVATYPTKRRIQNKYILEERAFSCYFWPHYKVKPLGWIILSSFDYDAVIFDSLCVCIAQEQCHHESHADKLHGTDGSWDSFLGEPLICLYQEGAVSFTAHLLSFHRYNCNWTLYSHSLTLLSPFTFAFFLSDCRLCQ